MVPAACCPLLSAYVWFSVLPGLPATPLCILILLTLPSPKVYLYFCPLPNIAVVPGSVAVVFVNCTTPPDVASSFTTLVVFAVNVVVCV